MVTADGFRAGLLYGEPGVGKTSLVRAGLIPHLRDHGIVALACEDLAAPAQSFAAGPVGVRHPAECGRAAGRVHRARGVERGRRPAVRVRRRRRRPRVRRRSGRSASSSELFTKVVSRSAGRARFLFVCASERHAACSAHSSAAPARCSRRSNRYELPRIPAPAATADPRSRAVAVGRRRGSAARRRGRARPRPRPAACSPPISRSPRWRCATCGSTIAGRAAEAGGPSELECGVAARRVRRDRQRALGAAAVRRARAGRDGPRAGRRRDPPHQPRSRTSRSRRSACSSSAA